MARATGAQAQMTLAFEATYGTKPTSGHTFIPFASTTLGAEQPLLAPELLGYGRDPQPPVKDVVTADGNVVVPIDPEAFGFWLKAAFGPPVSRGRSGGRSLYSHVFKSGSWNLPSLSIGTAMPEVPLYAMYSGCKLDSLSWQMGRSGLLTATASLVAQGEATSDTELASSPGKLTLKRFGHFNGSVARNGTALGEIVSADIEYSNNLDRIETIRADGKISGADPSIAALTGNLQVRFTDSTLLQQATDGTPCRLTFGYAITGAESLTLNVPAVYLPVPRREITGPGGVQVTFDWQAAKPTGTDPMATVTLVNTRDGY